MNLDKLKTINKTKTSTIIFKWLSGCNPISNTTNLVTFKEFLEKKFELNEQDFYSTFDNLEDAEVGFFSSAQPNIFHWEYNLKDVADVAMHPTKKVNIKKYEEVSIKPKKRLIQSEPSPLTFNLKEVLNTHDSKLALAAITKAEAPESKKPMTPIKTSRGRPKGAKNKPKIGDKLPAPERIKNARTQEVIFFFTTKRGTKIPFMLDDVDELVAQAQEIRSVI